MLNEIKEQSQKIIYELINKSNLCKNDIIVVGCSSSEILGQKIGTNSNLDVAQAIVNGILPTIKKYDLFLAAQCCEHLNRALVLEKRAAQIYNLEIVNVIPAKKAGGSFQLVFINFLMSLLLLKAF